MSPPRVLLLASSYPPRRGAPAAAFLETHARHLGLPCTVVAPGAADSPARETDGLLTVRRFQYWWPRRHAGLALADGIPDNLRLRPWLALQLPAFSVAFLRAAVRAATQADVIEAHWAVPGGFIGTLVARHAGLPLRIVLHSGDVHALSRLPGGRRLARHLWDVADEIVATSAVVRERFIDLLPAARASAARRRLPVTPLGIEWPAAALAPAGASRPRIVAFLGRLVPVKGVDLLVEALAGLPDVVLEVAGQGRERAALEAAAARHGVGVRFLGALGREGKAALFARASVVALPSRVLASGRTEGLPVVLLEALAAGRAVVATRVGAVPEALEDGRSGLLVPPDDARALRAALSAVLGDAGLATRLGAGARLAARPFAAQTTGARHGAALRCLAAAGRAGARAAEAADSRSRSLA